jgi:hypothetical protein
MKSFSLIVVGYNFNGNIFNWSVFEGFEVETCYMYIFYTSPIHLFSKSIIKSVGSILTHTWVFVGPTDSMINLEEKKYV